MFRGSTKFQTSINSFSRALSWGILCIDTFWSLPETQLTYSVVNLQTEQTPQHQDWYTLANTHVLNQPEPLTYPNQKLFFSFFVPLKYFADLLTYPIQMLFFFLPEFGLYNYCTYLGPYSNRVKKWSKWALLSKNFKLNNHPFIFDESNPVAICPVVSVIQAAAQPLIQGIIMNIMHVMIIMTSIVWFCVSPLW